MNMSSKYFLMEGEGIIDESDNREELDGKLDRLLAALKNDVVCRRGPSWQFRLVKVLRQEEYP